MGDQPPAPHQNSDAIISVGSMSDDYFSGMMLLASEKDICDRLATDDIVNRFASLSPVLRKYLWHT